MPSSLCSDGHFEIVKFLVEKGANIHADNDGALQWSLYNGHSEIAKFLVKKGANIYANIDCEIRWNSL